MTDLALSSAVSSLLLIQKQMSVTSSNISNANTAGYTAESEQVGALVVGGIGGGVQDMGTVSNVDKYLQAQVITANSQSTQADTYNTYYQNLQQTMGQIGQSDTGGNDISSQLATLQTAFATAAATPQNSALANAAVSALDDLTSNMRTTSQSIQALRTQADQQVSDTVTDVNTQLHAINDLNTQIASAQARGTSTAALQDQRSVALQNLSADIGISYYTNDQGALQITTTSGQTLITGNVVNELSHGAVSMSNSMSYPAGGVDGIMVQGNDITSTIHSGKLASLVQQRDSELPAAQNALDYLAQQVTSGINAISNQGSANPPPSTLTSAAPASYQGSDPVVPTTDMSVRIALTDSTGQVQSYQDIDLSGVNNVDDVIGAINGAFAADPNNPQNGPTIASLNSSGQLVLNSPTAGQGIALSTLSGTMNGTDFSSFFHLNDLITTGGSAASIAVNPSVLKNSSLMPVGKLTTTVQAALMGTSQQNGMPPFAGVGAGDGSIAQALSTTLLTNQTFSTGTATGTKTFSSATQDINATGGFVIQGGSAPVSVAVTSDMTPTDIANAINAAAQAAGAQTVDPDTGAISGVMAQVTGSGIYQLQISSGGNALKFTNVSGNALQTLGISSSSPTGYLGAATTTYGGFASNLISDIAGRSATAKDVSTEKSTTLSALQSTFSNQSGVNVDQQTATLTQLQNLYAASARVITTVNQMFSALLTAVQA